LIEKALTLPSSVQQIVSSQDSKYKIVGDSPKIQELKNSITKFARSQAPVFIQGQSGTGKELVARQIHLQGARADASFIAVNCGAIPSELMESEFFGHVKGSFTGASTDNPGLFKAAHGGTLFLDEIADLPLSMQVKLLRVIQEKTVRAVGSQSEESIDVRIISASHKDLDSMVEQGDFRQDLYYRINVIGVSVPTLSDRPDDIGELTRHIIDKHNTANQLKVSLSPDALHSLKNYDFPGNVRELENILERATALCDDNTISSADLRLPNLPLNTRDNPPSLSQLTQSIEKDQIVSALESNRWNQSAAARTLGITLRQLRYKIEKMQLNKV
jgi:two-component system response regulator PilR (NtrC family)